MKKKAYFVILFLCFAMFNITQAKSDLLPVYLRTEYKVEPFIDVLQPSLSWELQSGTSNQVQKAYQILVASSREMLAADKGDLEPTPYFYYHQLIVFSKSKTIQDYEQFISGG